MPITPQECTSPQVSDPLLESIYERVDDILKTGQRIISLSKPEELGYAGVHGVIGYIRRAYEGAGWKVDVYENRIEFSPLSTMANKEMPKQLEDVVESK